MSNILDDILNGRVEVHDLGELFGERRRPINEEEMKERIKQTFSFITELRDRFKTVDPDSLLALNVINASLSIHEAVARETMAKVNHEDRATNPFIEIMGKLMEATAEALSELDKLADVRESAYHAGYHDGAGTASGS